MICVDASVAVKCLFPEQRSAEALALLQDAGERGERLIAPHLLPIETNNAIRRRMQRDGLTPDQARTLLSTFLAVPITLARSKAGDHSRIHQEALLIADRFALRAVYDAYYLAVAKMRGSAFWTDDQRLLRAVGAGLSDLHWIGDYGRRCREGLCRPR